MKKLVEFVALFLWGGFASLLVPILIEGAIESLANIIVHRIDPSRWPLTPDERVNHVLCDSDAGMKESIGKVFGAAVFVLPLSASGWIFLTTNDVPASILWSLRLFSPAILFFCLMGTVRFAWRRAHRDAIASQLLAERERWDSSGGNTRIFVCRRDREPVARMLFDSMTVGCYRHGMTVLQYTDLEWPTYHLTESRVNKTFTLEGRSNPAVVTLASLVVWLDIGETSPAMKGELHVARKMQMAIVRIHCMSDMRDKFVITGSNGSRGTAPLEMIVDVAIEKLQEIIQSWRQPESVK